MTKSKYQLNYKLIISFLLLLGALLVSFFYLEEITWLLEVIVLAPITNWTFGALIVSLLFFHNKKNHNLKKNEISDKEGLDKATDYWFFGLRNFAIFVGFKTMLSLSFFSQVFNCNESLSDSKFVFYICGFLLGMLIFFNLKPIVKDTFGNTVPVKVSKNKRAS